MKINILCYHLDQGGVEKMAVEYSNELVKMGHSVNLNVIYKLKNEKFTLSPKVKTKKLIGFYVKGMDKIVSLFPKKFLYRLFNFNDADIEIAFQADLPTKIISESSNNHSMKIAWIHGIGMQFDESYSKYDKIVFVGEDVKNHYKNEFENIENHKLQVIYNPINKQDIIEKSTEVVVEKFMSDRKKIISVGRLSKEKSFDRLILAFHQLINEYNHDIDLLIVGEGDERSNLENLIAELELEERVHLLGFKKNPYSYMAISDIYICSSDYEGFNVAMTEAGVLGKPILSTPVYGTEDFLGKDSERGLITDFSSEDIANKANLLLTDDSLRKTISNNILVKVDEIIDKHHKDIIELFSIQK